MKIFDCFPYFNEKEILELRIKTLYDHVDGFIIAEADRTHSGKFKPYTCADTLKSLNIPLDKISILHVGLKDFDNIKQEWIDLIVGNRIKNGQSVDDQESVLREIKIAANWARERNQRNILARTFQDNAAYIVSDCDEIINPQFIPAIVEKIKQDPKVLLRLNFVYLHARPNLRLHDSSGEAWTFYDPFVCTKYHTTKYELSQIREQHSTGVNVIDDPIIYINDEMGWHFSWMGAPDRLKYKMQSFAHSEDKKDHLFSSAEYELNSNSMYQRIDNYIPTAESQDIFGRTSTILKSYPLEKLPKTLFQLPHIKNFMFGAN